MMSSNSNNLSKFHVSGLSASELEQSLTKAISDCLKDKLRRIGTKW